MSAPLWRRARTSLKRLVVPVARRLAPVRNDPTPETWGLELGADGTLTLAGVSLAALLEREGSPLHVVNAARLTSNANRFRAPGAAHPLEASQVFYSYKTNPVPGVLEILRDRGLGAEVASEYELWLALRLGVPSRDIVYNGPARSAESLALAIERGVGLININERSEVARLAQAARAAGKPARVGVRVVVPGATRGQFGERIEDGSALATFREALGHPELEVVGLHSHNNHEISAAQHVDELVVPLLAFADELHRALGLELEVIDVGGNLACPTVSPLSALARRWSLSTGCEPTRRRPEAVLSVEDYRARVLERVTSHYQACHRRVPRVFFEPGRAITADCQLLLCRAVRVRRDPADETIGVVLDAGCNVAEPLVSETHQLFSLSPRHGPPRIHRLTGPNCALADTLYPAWRMPEVAVGDGFAIMDSGAYFVPFSTCFSRARPAVVLVDEGRVRTLRRAETFDDLVSLDASGERPRPKARAAGGSLSLARGNP